MRSDQLSDHANYPLHRPAPNAHPAWYWGLLSTVQVTQTHDVQARRDLHVGQRIHLQKRGYRTLNLSRDRSHVAQGRQKQAVGQTDTQWRCGQ